MTQVGVAVWGLGEHARRNIVPALMQCQLAKPVGLATRDRDVLTSVSKSTGIPAYADPGDMLADPSVDVVFLATPTGLHSELGHRVIGAGKHLWVEKPLSSLPSDALSLIEHGRRSGKAVFEASMFAFHPQFEMAHRLLNDGLIGSVMSVSARFGFPHLDESNFRYVKELGGGALLDAGYYPLSAVRRLIAGDIRVLGASILQPVGRSVDMAGSAYVASIDGVVGFADWGFGRAYRNEIEVWGELGSMRIERAFSKPPTLGTSVVVRLQNGDVFDKTVDPANHFTIMLEAFAAAVASGSLDDLTRDAEMQARLMGAVLETANRR